MKRSIAFYIHNYGGLGHTKRISEIIREILRLSKNISIIVIESGESHRFLFPVDHRLKHIELEKYETTGYTYEKNNTNLRIGLRRRVILEKIASDLAIHTLVIEHFPFGRAAIADEIIHFIATVKVHQRGVKIISSVRDIIESDTQVNPLHVELFERILIHGDPGVSQIPTNTTIEKKSIYTGYVVNQHTEKIKKYDIIINIGGGQDGIDSVYNFFSLLSRSGILQENPKILLLLGSKFESHKDDIGKMYAGIKHLEIAEFVGGLDSLKKGARLLVQMGGYNNLVESAYIGIPSIIYPRMSDTEQQIRLKLFEQQFVNIHTGLALTADKLEEIWHTPQSSGIDASLFDGATFSALFLLNYGKIEYLKLRVTNICNANCRMCGVIRRPYKTLGKEKIYSSILDFYKIGGKILNLTGGEPTIYKNYMDIFLYAKYLGLKTSLSTNGADFDEYFEKKLIHHSGGKLIDFIDISVDGLGALHDERREFEGLFAKIEYGLPILKKNNIFLHINVTLRKDNIHEAREIFDFFREKGVHSISFGIVAPSPFNTIDDLVPTKEGILKFYRDDYTYIQENAGDIQLRFSPEFPEDGDIEKFVTAIQNQHLFEKKIGTQCPIISNQKEIRINEDGDIAPCCTLDDFPDTIGNIYSHTLLKILCSEKYYTFIHKEFPYISEGCAHCKLLN